MPSVTQSPLFSLPMYDLPEVRAATDAWAAGLARHLRAAGFAVPETLERGRDYRDHWRDPALLLSQTCGYPFTHEFAGRLRLLATPVYAAEGCSGADYSSVIVARGGGPVRTLADARGGRAVYNTADSMSGHLALRAMIAPFAGGRAFFGSVAESGTHVRSMEMVANGVADIAAIDAVTFALVRRVRPEAVAPLAVIARGPPVPALPYVTAMNRPPAEMVRLKRALAEAADDSALREARAVLLIERFEFLQPDEYRRILDVEAKCEALGYTALT
jgi:ABC-type phosphate/phosphonate transport system substrate-binding protein